MKVPALILVPLSVGLLASAQALTIDTVTVGDIGNPDDSTGYGGVSYSYAIGKYEVTLNQYTEFLNAVADTDTYALYNPSMATNLNIAGISRSGSSGSYFYSVIGDGNRPVTYVSWFDAARFTNWLHNGQTFGLQTAATTEDGAYPLDGATSGPGFAKNGLAQWWVPSPNEWYKAAYYDPTTGAGGGDNYWMYPTQSDTQPNSRNGSATDPNSANYMFRDGIATEFNGGFAVTNSQDYSLSQNYLTAVGSFTQADSYYGTFDQGGNVQEWNDTLSPIWFGHVVRGGSWGHDETSLHASASYPRSPTDETYSTGFRVATVPEPTVAVSLLLTGAWLLARRKRPLNG